MPRKQNTRKASSSSSFRTPPASSCSGHCRIDRCVSGSCRHRSRATAKVASSIRDIVLRTAQLRAEKAKLLGYDNWAAYQLEDQTAHDVPTVNKLLADLAPPAVANVKREAAEQQKMIDQGKGAFQIGACDWDFYSEKVRKAKYNFDESEVRPYYELNHVIVDGVFIAANKESWLTFKERHDLPVYQPEVRVWEVFDRDG